MHQYRFTINGNDVQPTSLDGFSRILDISDGRIRRVQYSGTLQFCDDAYDDLKNVYFFITPEAVCTETEVIIEYRSNPQDPWLPFGDAFIDRETIEYNNFTRTIQFSLIANDNIAKIDQNASTEFTIDRNIGDLVTMFEYESGTDYTTQRRFFNVADVINELLDKMGTNSTLLSTLFTTTYQPKIEQIQVQALAAGDVYQVSIAQIFTNSIIATITAPAGGLTAVQVGDALEVMLQYNLAANEKTALKSFYNVCVGRQGADVVITSNVAVPANITITLNGVGIFPIPVVIIQPFQFGLQDLCISAKGMNDTDLEISWNQLWNWLSTRFNLGMEAVDPNTIQIDWLFDMVQGTTPATIIRENVYEFTRKLDTTYMKATMALGSKFRISNYEQSQGIGENVATWQWAAPTNDYARVGLQNQIDFDFNNVPEALVFDLDFENAGGAWAVIQYNAARSLTIQFTLNLIIQANNVNSQSNNFIDVRVNGVVVETIAWPMVLNGAPIFSSRTTDILCLNPTDQVIFEIRNAAPDWDISLIPNFGTNTHQLETIITPSCSDVPEVNEEAYEIDGLVYQFEDFNPGCVGQFDNQNESTIYGEMGYAISQHIQGIQEYDNTYFVIMKETGLQEARKFEVCYYHPFDPDCICRDNNFFSQFFYNIPISHFYSAYLTAFTLPSDLNGVLYLKEIDYDGAIFTLTETVDKSGFYLSIIKDIEIINFEDCLSPEELKVVEAERTVGFNIDETILGPFIFDNRYRKIEFELATGLTRFELRGQRF